MASAVRAVGVALLAFAVVLASYAVFVRTHDGQRLDQLATRELGQSSATRASLTTYLHVITTGLVVMILAVCVVIALARQRWGLGAGALTLVAGASLTTEVLKHRVLTRPALGFGESNSFPSGHMTVIASLVLAVLLVVPPAWRGLVRLAGSVEVAVVGISTVIAGWHRPSDVVAGLAISLAWGALVLAAVSLGRGGEPVPRPTSQPLTLLAGLGVAAAVFVALGVRPGHAIDHLIALTLTMTGLALAGALAIGVFARLADTRVG